MRSIELFSGRCHGPAIGTQALYLDSELMPDIRNMLMEEKHVESLDCKRIEDSIFEMYREHPIVISNFRVTTDPFKNLSYEEIKCDLTNGFDVLLSQWQPDNHTLAPSCFENVGCYIDDHELVFRITKSPTAQEEWKVYKEWVLITISKLDFSIKSYNQKLIERIRYLLPILLDEYRNKQKRDEDTRSVSENFKA